jgi:hypothetical protein
MKYFFIFFALTACGVMAASDDTVVDTAASPEPAVKTKKSTDENLPEKLVRFYVEPNISNSEESADGVALQPIPALIMPNNVCIINTDLAPDRSIEDHIVACIRAQRIRNTIAR